MCDNRIWCDIFKRHFFIPINTPICILLRHTNCDTNETNTDLLPSNRNIRNFFFFKVFISILGGFCSCENDLKHHFQNWIFFLPSGKQSIMWIGAVLLYFFGAILVFYFQLPPPMFNEQTPPLFVF